MLATVLATLALFGQQPDVQAFRDAFALRHSETPTEKADPGIIKAMDILIAKVRRDVKPTTTPEEIEKMLRPYSQAIAQEEVFSTSYPNISASIARGPSRIAIGVQMGACSRLRVFNTALNKPIPVPKQFDWTYRYESLPQFLPGGKLVVDGPGIQDAGVRYGYRVALLLPSEMGYVVAKQFEGVWVLEDQAEGHIGTTDSGITLNTIEQPKSFFTSSPAKVFETVLTYDWSTPTPRLIKTNRKNPVFRVVDAWMANAMKTPKTDLEKSFLKAYGKEHQMLDSWSERGTDVTATFDGTTYLFTLKRDGTSYKLVTFTVNK